MEEALAPLLWLAMFHDVSLDYLVSRRHAHGKLFSLSLPPGVATLASKTTEGAASDARRLMVRGNLSKEWLQMRVRQPRLMGENNVLLPYPRFRVDF